MHDIAWAIVRGRRGGGEGVLVDITRLRLYGKDICHLASATALCQDLVEGFSADTTTPHRVGNVPCKSIPVPPKILSRVYRTVTESLANELMGRFVHSH